MRLETERLILRPWRETDATRLFEIASDERVGKAAGWLPPKTKEDSRLIIKDLLDKPEIYAICLKENGDLIGSIGILQGEDSNIGLLDNDAEIGFWIGYSYWGNGYASEALRSIVDHAFRNLHAQNLWCCYFPSNKRSLRVQKKNGFSFHHSRKNSYWRPLDTTVNERISKLEKATWLKINKRR